MTGRRKIVLAAIALMAAVGVAGCGLPAGVDGKLTNAWAAPPTPQLVEAKAGDCVVTRAEQTTPHDNPITICTNTHHREIVHVGTFTGAAAALAVPPRIKENATGAEAAAQATAYAECSKQASAYLGRPWYSIHLDLFVVLPTDRAWQAGRKWFRCELQEVDWYSNNPKARTSSLKGNAFPVSCINFTGDEAKEVPCTTKHNGEFVGGFDATSATPPKTDKQYEAYHKRCRDLIGAYIGVARSRVQYVTGTYLWYEHDDEYWSSGRRGMLCFIWLGEKKYMTGSAKGKGGRNLP